MEKKRVLIAVDKEAWESSQQLLKDMKISNQIFNEMLNEFIRSQYKLLKGLKEKRDQGQNVSMGDFLKIMGGIISDLGDDQIKLDV